MTSFKQTPFPLIRSGSKVIDWPDKGTERTNRSPLGDVADWVALCQACAAVQGPVGAQHCPGPVCQTRVILQHRRRNR